MTDASTIPSAVIRPQRTRSWAWLVPLLALAFAAWLGYSAWSTRGVVISVQLADGFGLKAGDEVRYRGISVGKIDAVTLTPDLESVLVTARLRADSDLLARQGSQFWVVRPQLRLTRVEGLDTLVGPRYLAVLPARDDGRNLAPQRHFVGLDSPPVAESVQPGDLVITLLSPQRGSLRPGAPVTYRQTQVGTILSVGLTGDGSAVEARAQIQQPFVPLIRPNTRFWDVGGIQAKLGFSGLSVEIESPETLIAGGVAFATPPPAEAGSEIVRTGYRFHLSPKADDDWLHWQPMVAIGNSLLPPGVMPPSPLRATIGWKQGRLIKSARTNRGCVLQTADGLLGPADLFKPGEKADPDSAVLEVAGVVVPLAQGLVWEHNGLALLKASVISAQWPNAQQRRGSDPEDCVVIADSAESPLPLAASRLTRKDQQWLIDPAISINPDWHGACVISRTDGKLLGMLLANGSRPAIALLPEKS